MFWWLDKQLRDIRGTPHYAIADLPEVTVGRIVGVARPLDHKMIEAALSGRLCLAYEARAVCQGHYAPGGGKAPDLELATEIEGVPFLVEDDTGVAIVDPASARAALCIDRKANLLVDKTERQLAFL